MHKIAHYIWHNFSNGESNYTKHVKLARCPRLIIRKALNLYGSGFLNGGRGGIRTHGTLVTYDGFQDRSYQPLRHSSICDCRLSSTILYYNSKKFL